jgi:hypothetical protein
MTAKRRKPQPYLPTRDRLVALSDAQCKLLSYVHALRDKLATAEAAELAAYRALGTAVLEAGNAYPEDAQMVALVQHYRNNPR